MTSSHVSVRLAACLAAAALVFLVGAGAASALPGAELSPIRGMAYQPAPSDYKGDGSGVYYDTDFFNDDFKKLWDDANGGRGDLKVMATQLRINFLHLYNWNPGRNHLGFLNEAYQNGIRVAVPISNYFVSGKDPSQAADIEKIVKQVYVDTAGNPSTVPHPAVVMWLIANEYDLHEGEDPNITATKVATATAQLVAAEKDAGATKLLPVSVPVSFGTFGGDPGVVKTLEAIAALKANPDLGEAFVSSRFVAAVNPQNEGSFIAQWLPKFKQQVPNTMLWFSELGTAVEHSCDGYPQPCTPSEQQQAVFNLGEWQASPPGAEGILLGGAQFEFMDEPWKGGPDATFGIYKFNGSYTEENTTGGKYRIDELVRKPSWNSTQQAFAAGGPYSFSGGGAGDGVDDPDGGVGGPGGGDGSSGGPAAAGVPGSSGLCDPLLFACGATATAGPQPAPFTPVAAGGDDGSAVGAPSMPNLRATATARWANGAVRVRVRVLVSQPRLVRQAVLVRVSIPSLGVSEDVRIRVKAGGVVTKTIVLEAPSSAIGRRAVVRIDPTDRVGESRERDNTARVRIT